MHAKLTEALDANRKEILKFQKKRKAGGLSSKDIEDVKILDSTIAKNIKSFNALEVKIESDKKKRVVLKNADGSCRIMIPGIKTKLTIEEITEKDVLTGVEHRITEIANIPTDRTFRNAWTDDNDTDTIDVDMVKARPIQMDIIRGLRKEKLKDLDIQFMRALEQSDTKEQTKIAEQRQILFDLPTTYDLSQYHTPEALKEAIPKEVL